MTDEKQDDTMDQNNQESRRKHYATHMSVRSSAHTAHSFARLLTHSLTHSLARGTVNNQMAILAVFFFSSLQKNSGPPHRTIEDIRFVHLCFSRV